jgi:hypothetical protein
MRPRVPAFIACLTRIPGNPIMSNIIPINPKIAAKGDGASLPGELKTILSTSKMMYATLPTSNAIPLRRKRL